MIGPRSTIARAMGLVALAAIGLAAIRHPTRLASNAVFSVTLAILAGATVAALASRGRSRLARTAFAGCGWGYLVLSIGPWFESKVGPYLLTSTLIEIGYESSTRSKDLYTNFEGNGYGRQSIDRPLTSFVYLNAETINPDLGTDLSFTPLTPYPLYRIAHSLLALAAAAAGGLFALALTRRPNDEPPDRP